MSAVMVAMFDDYAVADRVRMELVLDGFPTDRVELTAVCDPGRAAVHPADTPHGKFVQYFTSIFTRADERDFPERFAERLDHGAAAITVHPRGMVETERAAQILSHAHPSETAEHELEQQSFEYAAARHARPWASHFWVENHSNAHCIYCRLFERDLPPN